MARDTPHRSDLVGDLEDRLAADGFAPIPDRAVDVTEHGAVGDGETVSTAPIQDAIDAAADAGGGVVTVPEGTFRTGALFLDDHVELHLAAGAVLEAVTDEDAYPTVDGRVGGIEMAWPAAVVNVRDAERVRLTGEGTIDGNGEFWWEKFLGMQDDYEDRGLRWAVDYDCERVRPVVVHDAADVRLEGFTVRRAGFWTVTLTYSERVHVDGLTVRNAAGDYGPSTDGINVDSSRDVLIEDCDVACDDDCICVKAGRDADGLRVGRPTENVVIRDCVTREGHGMVTVGSDMSGGVRNVEVRDLEARGTRAGVRFKSARTRGGVVEDVRVRNVTLRDVDTAFEWNLDWFPEFSYPTIPDEIPDDEVPDHWRTLAEPVEPPERGIPKFHDVEVRDVTGMGVGTVWDVQAHPERPIHDVRFEGVDVEAETVGRVEHAADWTMDDVVVRAGDGAGLELVECENVEGADIE